MFVKSENLEDVITSYFDTVTSNKQFDSGQLIDELLTGQYNSDEWFGIFLLTVKMLYIYCIAFI